MVEIGTEFIAGVAGTIMLMLLFLMVVVLWDIALALRDVAEKIDYLEDDVDSDLAAIDGTLTRIYDRMGGRSGVSGETPTDPELSGQAGVGATGLTAGSGGSADRSVGAASAEGTPAGVGHATSESAGATTTTGAAGRRQVASPPTNGSRNGGPAAADAGASMAGAELDPGAAAPVTEDVDDVSTEQPDDDADAHADDDADAHADDDADEAGEDDVDEDADDATVEYDGSDSDEASGPDGGSAADDAEGSTTADDSAREESGSDGDADDSDSTEDDESAGAPTEDGEVADEGDAIDDATTEEDGVENAPGDDATAEQIEGDEHDGADGLGADSATFGPLTADAAEETEGLSPDGRAEDSSYGVELEESDDDEGFGMEQYGIGETRAVDDDAGSGSHGSNSDREDAQGTGKPGRTSLRSQLRANAESNAAPPSDTEDDGDGSVPPDGSGDGRDGDGDELAGLDELGGEDIAETTITDVGTVSLEDLRRSPIDPDTDGDSTALPHGEAPDGEAPDGEAPDGEAPDGEAPDGEAPDGDAADADDEDRVTAEDILAASEKDASEGSGVDSGDRSDGTAPTDASGAVDGGGDGGDGGNGGNGGNGDYGGDADDADGVAATESDDAVDEPAADEAALAGDADTDADVEERQIDPDDDDLEDEDGGDIAELVNRELDTLTQEVGGTSMTPDVSDATLDAAVSEIDGGTYTFPLSGSAFEVTAGADSETATLQFMPEGGIDLDGARERLLKYQLRNYLDRDETAHAELSVSGDTVVLEIPAADGPAISAWADAAVQIIDRTLYLSKDDE